ncbi:hypothetical protein UlMin_031958 [Ulmus minor]
MTNPHQNSSFSPNSSSLKKKFAKRFLRALLRIYRHQQQRPNSLSSREIKKCCRRVRFAADASMASAVGSRRLWSQALLWKIRYQARNRAFLRRVGTNIAKRKGLKAEKRGGKIEGLIGQEKKLRKLVPGGVAMDTCSLLDETADYIRCLNTQVMVMRRIAQIYTT